MTISSLGGQKTLNAGPWSYPVHLILFVDDRDQSLPRKFASSSALIPEINMIRH